MKKYLLFLAFLIATMARLKAFLYYTNYTDDQIIHVTYQVYYKASDNSSWESWMETTTLLPGESLWLDDNHWWEFWSLWEEFEPYYGGEGGVGASGSVSFNPSTTNVQVGETIDFHVWANNSAGLSLIGIESCNSAGVPVENRGEIAVSGTSADNVFTVDFGGPGIYYFDCYFWSADHSQLTRSAVKSVTVSSGPAVSGMSITKGSSWELLANAASGDDYTFDNWGSDSITLRARDPSGNFSGSQTQWHVTDLINDAVIHDWVTQDSISFSDLLGKAFMVKSRTLSNNSEFNIQLNFTESPYMAGIDGNPYKINPPDTTYPYGGQRIASCSLGCLRNVLHMKGKPVPTEDQLVAIMVQNGKPEADFGTETGGMGTSEAEARFNQILNPSNLTATRLNGIHRDDLAQKLDNGAVVIVSYPVYRVDATTGVTSFRGGHMIVMHKVGDKIEVVDPFDGTKKKYKKDDALNKIHWGGQPPMTGDVWEITP